MRQVSEPRANELQYLLNASSGQHEGDGGRLRQLINESAFVKAAGTDKDVEKVLLGLWRVEGYWLNGGYTAEQYKYHLGIALETWVTIAGITSVLWLLLTCAVRWVYAGFRGPQRSGRSGTE